MTERQSATFGGQSLDPILNTRTNFDGLSLPMTALPYGGGIVPSTPFAPASGPGVITMDAVIVNRDDELFSARNVFERMKFMGFQRLTLHMRGDDTDENPDMWVIARMVGEPIEVPNETGIDAVLLRIRLTFDAPDPRWRTELDNETMMRWGEEWRFSGGDALPTFERPATWRWLEADDVANSGWTKVTIDGTDSYSFQPTTEGTTWTVLQWILVSEDDETIPAWRFTNTSPDGVVLIKIKGAETAELAAGGTTFSKAEWSVDPENGTFLRNGRSKSFWANIEYSDSRFMMLLPGDAGTNNLELKTIDGSDFDNLVLYYRHEACFV